MFFPKEDQINSHQSVLTDAKSDFLTYLENSGFLQMKIDRTTYDLS